MPLDLDGLDGLFREARPRQPGPPPIPLEAVSAATAPQVEERVVPPSPPSRRENPSSWPLLAGLAGVAVVALALVSVGLDRLAEHTTNVVADASATSRPAEGVAEPPAVRPTTPVLRPPAREPSPPPREEQPASSVPTDVPLVEVPTPFRFRFNGCTPSPLSAGQAADLEARLRELARRCGPSTPLELTGHTDATGSIYANRLVGLCRAVRVRDVLLRNAVPAAVVATAGSARPVASNQTSEGQDANRRVTVACAAPSMSAKETHP